MSDPFGVENRTYVIVGGTTGLGLAAAAKLVEHSANVLVLGRSENSLINALDQLGPTARGMTGDATDSQSAERAIQLAVAEFGQLDGLYHVAGGSGRAMGDGPLHELSDEGWQFTANLNLSSIIYSNRAAVRQFLAQNSRGCILNMSSVLGYSPSSEFFASHGYAAAKSAILGFTKSIAGYYAKQNIRANVIAPALVATPMSARAQENEEILEYVSRKQPLEGGRIGSPDDLDEAVLYLLGTTSKFVTGQTLAVDGGWTVSEG